MERLPSVEDLAATYNTPAYADPMEAVEDYRQYQREWADTQLGSHAVSTRMELPRGRIRSWEDGSQPDVVNGIETAREHGWLECAIDGEIFGALNRLVAGVFSGGSISVETFEPSYSAPDDLVDSQLRSDLETLGVGSRVALSNSGNVEEIRPESDASVLGRVLVALGAPAGEKAGVVERLPSYLYRHPEATQREFARVYVANRATDRRDRDFYQIREERSDRYLDAVATLLKKTMDVEVWRGDRTVRFRKAGMAALGLD
jgi:hypothetical protein